MQSFKKYFPWNYYSTSRPGVISMGIIAFILFICALFSSYQLITGKCYINSGIKLENYSEQVWKATDTNTHSVRHFLKINYKIVNKESGMVVNGEDESIRLTETGDIYFADRKCLDIYRLGYKPIYYGGIYIAIIFIFVAFLICADIPYTCENEIIFPNTVFIFYFLSWLISTIFEFVLDFIIEHFEKIKTFFDIK